MPYLRNFWYVAAWANEIGSDRLLSRQICDEHVVMFRDDSPLSSCRLA